MEKKHTHYSNMIGHEYMDKEIIQELNKYHDDPSKQGKYDAIRSTCDALMNAIVDNCPHCADRTTALQTVRLARMWANSSIALDH